MSPLIFASCRDCPSCLASAETVFDLLFPAETTIHKNGFLQRLSCDSASFQDSRQEAISHGQSLQEAINQAQQSRQEAKNRGQSWRTPNMTDRLCRMCKLADSFVSCVYGSMVYQ